MPGLLSGYFVPLGIAFQTRGFARLQSEFGRYESMTAAIEDRNNRLVSQNERLLRTVGAVAVGFGALGAAGLTQAITLARLAEQYNRTERSVTMLAYAHGVSAEALVAERAELYQMGVTMTAAEETMRALMAAGIDLSRSSELVAAAQDMASFSGAKLTDVLQAYTAAVTSATTRGLRQYNIAAATEKVYRWYAESVDKTTQSLTQLERRQAVLEYILHVGNQLSGIYARNLGNVAERSELLQVALSNLGTEAGQVLIPIVLKGIGYLEILVDWLRSLDEEQRDNIVRWVTWTSALMAAFTVLSFMLPAMTLFGKALAALVPMLLEMASGAALAVATGEGLAGVFAALGGGAVAAAKSVGVLAVTLVGSLAAAALKVTAALAPILLVLTAIGLAIKWIPVALEGPDFWDRMGERAEARYQELAEQAIEAGRNIGSQAAEGYSDEFIQGIQSQGMEALQVAQDLMDPFKRPPFDVESAGMDFIRRWLAGAEQATAEQARAVADRLRSEIEPALWGVKDTLFDIRSEIYRLDTALWPLEVQVRRISAAVDLVVIPMQRQRRALQRQLEDLERLQRAEDARLNLYLKQLERQAEEVKRLLELDRERLRVLDWEIFIEEQRNKILGRETSKRLIEMKTEQGLVQDQYDARSLEYDMLREQIRAEKDRLQALKEVADAQIEALREQIWALDRMIDLEQERARYAEEELRLAEALQSEDRIRAESQQRYWQEQQRQLQHQLEILSRVDKMLGEIDYEEAFTADLLAHLDEGFEQYAEAVRQGMDELVEDLKKDMPGLLQAVLGVQPEVEEPEDLGGWQKFRLRVRAWYETLMPAGVRGPGEVFEDYFDRGLNEKVGDWWAEQAAKVDPRVTSSLLVMATPQGREWVLKYAWARFQAWWSEDVSAWASQAWEDVSAWASTAWENVSTWVSTAWSNIKTAASEKWQEFTTWVSTELTALDQDVSEGWDVIKTTLSEAPGKAWETVKTAASEKWQEFLTWLEEKLVDLRNNFFETQIGALGLLLILYIYQQYKSIKTWLEENSPFKNIGTKIVEGIRSGLEEAWSSLTTWIQEQIQKLPEWMKEWLGIESPSKLTQPVGAGLAAGIQKGFEDSWAAWLPRIETTVQASMSGPRMVQGTASAPTTVINQYYITKQAPQVTVDAHYARTQSAATVAADVQQILSVL